MYHLLLRKMNPMRCFIIRWHWQSPRVTVLFAQIERMSPLALSAVNVKHIRSVITGPSATNLTLTGGRPSALTAQNSRNQWLANNCCTCRLRFLRLSTDSAVTRARNRPENVMYVFDRQAKRIQRNRTASLPDPAIYDYMKEEIGFRVADRICDVKRKFGVALDLGCGRGHVSKHILADMVDTLYQTDAAEEILAQSDVSPEVPTHKIHADEEYLPFVDNSLDLVVSSLSLHWVNDLPGCFQQVQSALKSDGCFLGAMFGGDTLYELRVALQLAETEREGGLGGHISPFTSVQDLGNLLNRAGFVMLTIDIDDITVNYPSMFELMADLKGMGENNCAWNRRVHLPVQTQMAAAAVYKDMFGKEQDSVPATFQVIHFIAWKPDPSQPKPARRGSGQVSMRQISEFEQMTKNLDLGGKDSSATQKLESQLKNLAQDIERQRTAVQGQKLEHQNKGESSPRSQGDQSPK